MFTRKSTDLYLKEGAPYHMFTMFGSVRDRQRKSFTEKSFSDGKFSCSCQWSSRHRPPAKGRRCDWDLGRFRGTAPFCRGCVEKICPKVDFESQVWKTEFSPSSGGCLF